MEIIFSERLKASEHKNNDKNEKKLQCVIPSTRNRLDKEVRDEVSLDIFKITKNNREV